METSSLHPDPWAPGASRIREQLLEHQLLGEIVRRMLLAGRRCEVLRAEFDGSGHDVVLEEDGVIRHVQLKAMRADGRRAHVNIHTALASKPSGCVIWMLVDPETLTASEFLWLGGTPGNRLPELGDRPVRHTKGDATGAKAVRPDLREVPRRRFERVCDYEALIDRLFGSERRRDVAKLLWHLRQQPYVGASAPTWAAHVQAGRFEALPETLGEDELAIFAHLVDGYALSGFATPCPEAGAWAERVSEDQRSLPSELWAAVFLEHRRLRFEGQGLEVSDSWLRATYAKLRESLQTPDGA